MQSVPLDEINIPEDRARKYFDEAALNDLAAAIHENGLLHAIVLHNDGKTLIAGERRIRAVKILNSKGLRFQYNGETVPEGSIPYISPGDVNHVQARQIEYSENVDRLNFTWQEKAMLVKELHELRTAEAEERGEKQTLTDTYHEVYDTNSAQATKVRDDIMVAHWLDDPEIAKAKDKKDALKRIERKLTQKHREALAEEYNSQDNKTPHELIKGDLQEEMPKLPEGTYDCIIADPPYGIAADKFNNQSAVEHTYEDSETYADSIMRTIAEEGLRITKYEAHCYVFHDIKRFPQVSQIFAEAGWYVWPWPLIWFKGTNVGILPRPNHGPRRTYEAILYCIKGDRETLTVGADVLTIPHDKAVERAAHKPPDLYEALINRTCIAGNKVIDPCCGTGPILQAASRTNTIATAIELDPVGFQQAVERLQLLDQGADPEQDDVLARFLEDAEDSDE